MSESFREQVERVIEMSRESGDTWDLSLNDQDALKAVLVRMSVLDEQAQSLRYALVKVRAHTSYVNPTPELLAGLLQSIERIADAALDPPSVTSNSDTRSVVVSGGVGHLFDRD